MSADLAFLFPGQGSQYVGMGADLPTAVEVFDRADRLLGFALSRLCLEGPAEALDDTVNTQPAILAVSVAALEALRERLGPPRWVAGHSLGEFSALVAAGALTFEDALYLVRERGRLMKEAGQRSPGGMAAVIGLERETVGRICAQISEQSSAHVGIANDNCPGQIVISGDEEALQAALAALSAAGARRAVRLAVSIAAHSPLMAGAAAEFRKLLDGVVIRPPQVTFVANATAGPLSDPDEIRQALGRQLTSPVHWNDSMRWIIGQGAACFVEVGPGDVLSGLLKRIDPTVERQTTAQLLEEG